jgi:phosphate transport system substrate-binding protein
VRRADGSGTSFIFTNYLSKVNAEWKAKVGEGTAVNWPMGAGGKGNEGVAAFVGRLPNSIGYVEYAYVKQNKLSYVQLQNADGAFVRLTTRLQGRRCRCRLEQELLPDPDQPARQGRLAHHRRHLHPDAQGAGQAAAGRATLKFFEWAYKNGDKTADDLDYVPMPGREGQIAKSWGQIKDGAGKAVAFK